MMELQGAFGCTPEQIAEAKAGHDARNLRLKERLAASGVDFAAARTVDLHFWSPSEHQAHSLSDLLKGRNYQLTVPGRFSDQNKQWNVEAQTVSIVQHVTSELFTGQHIELACLVGSRFDGWGTAI